MSQPPPPPQQPRPLPHTPHRRPRPGAPSVAPGAPSFQAQPRYQDYGNPRAYDTSVRPASGLTAARYAPAPIQRPAQARPPSASSTQLRRAAEVSQAATKVPKVSIAVWLALMVLGVAVLCVLRFFLLVFVLTSSSRPVWWPVTASLGSTSLLVVAGAMILADRW